MKQRIITAIFILAVAIPVLWFSDTVIWPIAVALLAAMGEFEFLRCVGMLSRKAVSIPAIALALLLPLGSEAVRNAGIGNEDTILLLNEKDYLLLICGILFAFLFYLYFYVILQRGKMPFGEIASTFAATFYIVGAFSALGTVRYLEHGAYLLPIVFIGAWICDVFAYFTGMICSKLAKTHKLIVEVSPKKTVEGSIGGIVFAIAATVLYGYLIGRFTDAVPNYFVLALMGLVLSVISQIGDLIMSLIKREHGIKDYSNIFPGHGGVLDRFDSILATSVGTAILAILFVPFH